MKEIDWHSDKITSIANLFKILNKLSTWGLFSQIDYILQTIPYETASSTMMIGVLRDTYKYRTILSSWKSTFLIIYDELKKRGIDVDLELAGIMIN